MKISEIIMESEADVCKKLATPPQMLTLRGFLVLSNPENSKLIKSFFTELTRRINYISPNTKVSMSGIESISWIGNFQNPTTLDKMRELADDIDIYLTSINGDHNPTEFSELKYKLNWKQKVVGLSGQECDWENFRVTDLRGTKIGKFVSN